MSNVIRVALPGYDALTDTNLDHFALYSDQDNVLIKEFKRASVSIVGDGTGTTLTIPHNLGYIPFFLVYVYDTQSVTNNNKWKLLCHNSAGASVPNYTATADTSNLYIRNFDAATISFKYYIFYDDISNSGSPTITESNDVIKVGKSGIDVLESKNPNDYIFHSDLNTFKILKEGTASISYTADGVYTFAHGASLSSPTSFMAFVKFPDGKTAVLPGKGVVYSYDSNYNISDTYIDTSNIGMYIVGLGSPVTLSVKYYIFETPLS